jgi:hypothetical protein
MKNLSRGAWLALAAVIAIPTTVAIAKKYEHSNWHGMSSETRARLDDGKLAMAKTALKLTPDQEKLWAPVETEVRGSFKARQEKMEARKKEREERKAARAERKEKKEPRGERKRPDLSERFDKMSAELSERADRMKAFSSAFKPFYASLTDEQKDVIRPLMRDLAPGFGMRGGKGPKHARSGWGGHHGKGHWGGWKKGDRAERGGPDGGSDKEAASERDEDAAPASSDTKE